jgi:hypothetical protein
VSRVFSLALLLIWIGTTASLPAQGPAVADPLASDANGWPLPSVLNDADDFAPLVPSAPLIERLPAPADEGYSPEVLRTVPPRRERTFSGGPPGGDRAPLKSQLTWLPAESLKDRPGSLGMNGQQLELGFPVRMEPGSIWLATAGVQRLEINTATILPDSGLEVPDQLWDIEAGLMHFRELADGWRAGGMIRVGSPSDQPYGAWRDMTVTLLAFLNVPSGERDAWNFSLFYSPTGQITFPIPGIAYVWRPSEQFQANLGVPFSLEYRPTEAFAVTASYMPLNNVQVLARQAWGPNWSFYAGYRTVNETFLLADRLDDEERLYLFDQRVTLGVERKLGYGWSLDLSSAYVFDRKLFQAEDFSGSRRDLLAIDAGMAWSLQVVWTR